MNGFIEKNRGLLRFYCIVARITGWILLIMPAAVFILALCSEDLVVDQHRYYILYLFGQEIILGFIALGLVLLGVGQFIKYLYEQDYRPGWILRHGDKVLYIYAAVPAVDTLVRYVFQTVAWRNADARYLLLAMLLAAAKALICVGLAHILRRLMPVIEESRMLV